MTTAVDICNVALSKLGDEANISSISPPDDSVQANYCSTFYPIALVNALDKHSWRFATRRSLLASRANDAPEEWPYCFAVPSDLINLIKLSVPSVDARDIDYAIEVAADATQVLYTNVTPVTLQYVSSTVSPSLFPPSFVEYLAALLAHYLAGPILKGDVGASAAIRFLELATALRETAVERDAQNTKITTHYTPEAIRARN